MCGDKWVSVIISTNTLRCNTRECFRPFLFNVYVNDPISIDNHVQFVLYADDTSLFLSSESVSDLFSAANAALDKLREWSEAKCLKINPKKSKAILFAQKNKRVSVTQELYLGNLTSI